MNKQTLIIFAGGLFIVLIAALLTQSLLQEEKQVDVIVEQVITPTEILVTAAPIKTGDPVGQGETEWAPWPEDMIFTGATIRGGDIAPESVEIPTGRSRRNLEAGQVLLISDLAQDDTGNFVAATLSEGMRGFTVEVNAATGVSGFVKPGDYVDVILSYKVNIPSDADIAQNAVSIVARNSSQTLLENVRVMAIDQTATEVEGVVRSKTITLEVTPRNSEILAMAVEMGTLSLALRKVGDDKLRMANGQKPRAVTDVRLSNALNEVMGGNGELMTVYGLGQKKSIYFLGGNSDIDTIENKEETNE